MRSAKSRIRVETSESAVSATSRKASPGDPRVAASSHPRNRRWSERAARAASWPDKIQRQHEHRIPAHSQGSWPQTRARERYCSIGWAFVLAPKTPARWTLEKLPDIYFG